MPRFKTVCLVGSLKFFEEFHRIEAMLKDEGIPCLAPIVYRDNPLSLLDDVEYPERILKKNRTREEETIGTKMHIAYVARSDIIYIIDRDGYVGLSTAVEIGVAWGLGKEIYSMEKVNDACVELLVRGGVITPEELVEKIKANPKI